jgi:hypothetical protein
MDPELGICPSAIGVQYQPDGRLSTFPKNTATFTGKLLIVPRSHFFCLSLLMLRMSSVVKISVASRPSHWMDTQFVVTLTTVPLSVRPETS